MTNVVGRKVFMEEDEEVRSAVEKLRKDFKLSTKYSANMIVWLAHQRGYNVPKELRQCG